MAAGSSEHDIDRFFAVCPELLCVLGAGGGFLRWNFAWESTLGHGAEQMAAMTFIDLVHPDDAAPTREQLALLRGEHGGPAVKARLENRCRTRSGAFVRLAWSLLSIPGEGLTYGSARNVDKQRRVQKVLIQRLEAKMRAEESLRKMAEQQVVLHGVVEEQRAEIRDLSTPIMQVWDGVLALPIVGALDRRRAADITERLLQRIVDTQSRHAILELTGVEELDTNTAHHLIRMLRSIALLGARGVIAGVRPSVARTLASLGGLEVEAGCVQRDLQHALRWCMNRHGG